MKAGRCPAWTVVSTSTETSCRSSSGRRDTCEEVTCGVTPPTNNIDPLFHLPSIGHSSRLEDMIGCFCTPMRSMGGRRSSERFGFSCFVSSEVLSVLVDSTMKLFTSNKTISSCDKFLFSTPPHIKSTLSAGLQKEVT